MNNDSRILGSGVYFFPGVTIDPTAMIGHGSVIGFPSIDLEYPSREQLETVIGANVRIGCYCVIEAGAQLGNGVKVDHYVRVGPGTTVGDDSHLLYGTRIHCDVRIGKRCRISGNCPDRTIIEDDVTHFGRLHHGYNSPSHAWDEREEGSAIIGARSVIGAGALVIGDVGIGKNVYIAAGEVVRHGVPDRCVVYKGKVVPGDQWRGRLKQSGFFEWGGSQ